MFMADFLVVRGRFGNGGFMVFWSLESIMILDTILHIETGGRCANSDHLSSAASWRASLGKFVHNCTGCVHRDMPQAG
jgi:hypothetical protein